MPECYDYFYSARKLRSTSTIENLNNTNTNWIQDAKNWPTSRAGIFGSSGPFTPNAAPHKEKVLGTHREYIKSVFPRVCFLPSIIRTFWQPSAYSVMISLFPHIATTCAHMCDVTSKTSQNISRSTEAVQITVPEYFPSVTPTFLSGLYPHRFTSLFWQVLQVRCENVEAEKESWRLSKLHFVSNTAQPRIKSRGVEHEKKKNNAFSCCDNQIDPLGGFSK